MDSAILSQIVTSTLLLMLSVFLVTCNQFLDTKTVKEGKNPGFLITNVKHLLKSTGDYKDSELKDAKIYFANKADSRPFELTKQGVIQVGGQVDREQICDERSKKRVRQRNQICQIDMCCRVLQVQVQKKNGDLKNYFVKIIIEDENDNQPQFPFTATEGGSGTITVPEDAIVGQTRLALPVATDSDSPRFGVKEYKWSAFKPLDTKNFFKLVTDSSKPYLEVISPLDRETQHEYRFTLTAYDGGYPSKTGTTSISVIVKDVNDNKPMFDKKVYKATIKEGQTSGLDMYFKVTDPDLDKNAEITYRIIDPDNRANKFFRVDARTGGATLHLKQEIDYEKDGDRFNFKIMASDRGQPPATSTAGVEIRVENVNDHKPVIEFLNNGKNLGSSYAHVNVMEGQGANQVIAQVHVSDQDSKLEEIECRVLQGGEQFHLEENRQVSPLIAASKQFNLRSKFAFDREKKNSFTVRLECDDKAKPVSEVSSAQLTVQVQDLNDNKPQFTRSKYFGTIKENAKESLIQMNDKIEAKDEDDSQNKAISYNLKDLPDRTDSLSFILNNHSPSLLTREALDFEKKNTYEFLVVATDHGKPPLKATSTVVIKVRDTNDNAPTLKKANYQFKVLEEMKPHTFVGKIEATDKDTEPENRQVIYSIQNYNPSKPFRATDYLTIGPHDGVIWTKKVIDREVVDSLVFTVSARNAVPLTHTSKVISESIVHVNIVDRNDNKPQLKPESMNNKRMIEMTLEASPKAENCVPFSLEFVDKDTVEDGNGRVEISLGKDRRTQLFTLREENRLLCLNRKRGADGSYGDTLPIEPGAYMITVLARDNPTNGTAQETTEKVMVKVRQRPVDLRRDPPKFRERGNGVGTDSRNVTIIAVLASIAGLFCLILLIIIYVFKKCGPVPEKDECSDKYDVSPPDNVNTLGRAHNTLDYRTGVTSRPEACGLLGSRMADMELDSCDDNPTGQTTLRYETQWRTPKAARRISNEDATMKKVSKSCESLEPSGRLCSALEDAQNGYQVLDPVLTIKSVRNNVPLVIDERTLKTQNSNSSGYQDLNEQTMNGKKNNNYYDCVNESEAMYSPRRSLKNAYFQTSFV